MPDLCAKLNSFPAHVRNVARLPMSNCGSMLSKKSQNTERLITAERQKKRRSPFDGPSVRLRKSPVSSPPDDDPPKIIFSLARQRLLKCKPEGTRLFRALAKLAVSKRDNQCLQIRQRLGGWPPPPLLRHGSWPCRTGDELVANRSFWYQHDLPTNAVFQYGKMRSAASESRVSRPTTGRNDPSATPARISRIVGFICAAVAFQSFHL